MNVIRASALGSCLKALVAEQLGYTPMDAPEKIQAAYERGNEHEDANFAAFHDDTMVTIRNRQREVVLDVLDGWQVVGHLDGEIHNAWIHKEFCVWEAKAPNAYDKFEKAYKTGDWSDPLAMRYRFQISAYMIATGLEAYVTSWDEERGVRGFGIELPPVDLETIQSRVTTIKEYVEGGIVPQACSQNDYPCPFYYLHEDAEEITEDPVLDRMVDDYESQGVDIKRREANRKELGAKIREHLAGKDTVTAQSKVTFYEQQGAERWDDAAVRKIIEGAGRDPEAFRVRGKPSERMKITRRSEGE